MERDALSYANALDRVTAEFDDLAVRAAQSKNQPLSEIERCNLAEQVAFSYYKKYPLFTLRHWLTNIVKTCFSLHSAELLYIDSEGKLPPYDSSRGWLSAFKRFLLPNVNAGFIKLVIYYEIIFFLLLVIGWFGFLMRAWYTYESLDVALKVLPFVGMFIVASLACGFARLRLPVEPFIMIGSLHFWLRFLKKKREKYE